MATIWEIWAIEQLPEYFNIQVSDELAKEIATDLEYTAHMENEMSFQMRGGISSKSVDYEKLYRQQKERADELERTNNIYLSNICKGRGVTPNQVRIEKEEVIIYSY